MAIRVSCVLLLALCSAGWAQGSVAGSPASSPVPSRTRPVCDGARERLRAGEIIVAEQPSADGRGIAMHACGAIDAPPRVVWAVLRDCDQFDEFMPRVARSELTRREGNVVWCDETIDMPFPLGDMQSLTRVVESPLSDGGFERRWQLVRGSYRRLDGAWTVRPFDPPASRSLVLYELDMEADTLIPNFLIRYAQSVAAPDVFNAVRERVRQCVADRTCTE